MEARGPPQGSGPPLRVPSAGNESSALQHPEVFGDRRSAHVKGLSEFFDGGRPRGEPGQNGATGWVGEGEERGAQCIV